MFSVKSKFYYPNISVAASMGDGICTSSKSVMCILFAPSQFDTASIIRQFSFFLHIVSAKPVVLIVSISFSMVISAVFNRGIRFCFTPHSRIFWINISATDGAGVTLFVLSVGVSMISCFVTSGICAISSCTSTLSISGSFFSEVSISSGSGSVLDSGSGSTIGCAIFISSTITVSCFQSSLSSIVYLIASLFFVIHSHSDIVSTSIGTEICLLST